VGGTGSGSCPKVVPALAVLNLCVLFDILWTVHRDIFAL
jgi:hypothetical protein